MTLNILLVFVPIGLVVLMITRKAFVLYQGRETSRIHYVLSQVSKYLAKRTYERVLSLLKLPLFSWLDSSIDHTSEVVYDDGRVLDSDGSNSQETPE